MGYAIQSWGVASAWLLLGGISAVAPAGTFALRGEEHFTREAHAPGARSTS